MQNDIKDRLFIKGIALFNQKKFYNAHESLHIGSGNWHMLSNETKSPLKIIEIQYGTKCIEDDIERVAVVGYD